MAATNLKIEIIENGKVVDTKVFSEFPVIFGRNPECNLRLEKSSFISRVHGSISIDKDDIIVTDLGSTNGINHDGKRHQTLRHSKNLEFTVQTLGVRIQLEGEEKEDDEVTNINIFKPEIPKSERRPAPKIPKIESVSRPDIIQPEEKEEVSGVQEHVEFSVAPIGNLKFVPIPSLCVQGIITWENDIYDVRNYFVGDHLLLGPDPKEPIYLPISEKRLDMGVFSQEGATIRIHPQLAWRVYSERTLLSMQEMIDQKKISKDTNGDFLISLGLDDVFSYEMMGGLSLHFRYVMRPGFKMERTWIENREEFKKAVTSSLGIHLFICLLAVLLAPKTDAPKIDNVPPRIAKLLVEPPSQILAEKPPLPPPPEPEPEPEKPKPPAMKPSVVEKPKNVKPPPKIVKKAPAPKKAPAFPIPNVAAPRKNPAPPAAPQKTAQQVEQEELMKMLNTLPAPPSGGSAAKGAPIQISKANVSPTGVKVSGVVAAANQARNVGPVGTAEKSFAVGSGGAYSTKNQSGTAGKRGVGGQIVGTPKLDPSIGRKQGITNEEVMKVVNKFLGDIQRCYERALFEDASIKGRVEYEWEISSAGQVISARVQSSQVTRGDTLNNCVLGVFKKMKFPSAKNGESTIAKIGFPFGK